jgi:hypothetical protein
MNNQRSSQVQRREQPQYRNSIRFPPERPEIWVIVGDERKPATVLDESFVGIGLMMEIGDAANVEVGDLLTVVSYDSPTQGRVKWVEHNQEARQVRLGIQWSPRPANTDVPTQPVDDSTRCTVQMPGLIEPEAVDHSGR